MSDGPSQHSTPTPYVCPTCSVRSSSTAPAQLSEGDKEIVLNSTRELSRQWSTVVGGLTGILGLAGIAFGNGKLTSGPDAVPVLFFIALGLAAIGTVLAALASYGTPPLPFSTPGSLKSLKSLKSWTDKAGGFDPKKGNPRAAASALWLALLAGLVSFVLAVIAVVIAISG